MPQELINVTVRPHLVSFLHRELYGEVEAIYDNKKVKLAKISKSSIIGQLLTVFKKNAKAVNVHKITGYSLFLKIIDDKEYTAVFHEKKQTSNSVLQLLPEDVILVNNYLESIYDTSLVEFVKGYSKNSKSSRSEVTKAVDAFMIEHNLFETEIDPMSLIRRYYDAIKRPNSLSKIQNQVGNRSKYFNSL